MQNRRLCLLALLALATAAAAVAQPPAGFVHRAGRSLVDGSGVPLRLDGVNLGGWLLWEGWILGGGFEGESKILGGLRQALGPDEAERFQQAWRERFITGDDLDRIAVLGFKVVRLPLNYRLLVDDDHPESYRDAGWQVLDRLLDWCEHSKLYVVLDLHAAPGAQSSLFVADPAEGKAGLWSSADHQRQTVALWRAIAQRYRDRGIIAGYDLLNEPAPPDGAALAVLDRRLVAAVREVDPHHLILLEGSKAASDFAMFNGRLDENQAYSFHMYTWFGDDRRRRLAGYRARSAADDTPLWNGEFGENSYDLVASTQAMYRDPANGVSGSCFWTWKRAPAPHPGLRTFVVPDDWRAVMRSIARGGPSIGRPRAVAAAQALLEAVGHSTEDAKMVQALTGKGQP
jgi:hypothetical protein